MPMFIDENIEDRRKQRRATAPLADRSIILAVNDSPIVMQTAAGDTMTLIECYKRLVGPTQGSISFNN